MVRYPDPCDRHVYVHTLTVKEPENRNVIVTLTYETSIPKQRIVYNVVDALRREDADSDLVGVKADDFGLEEEDNGEETPER